MRILLAEDEPALNKVLVKLLEKHNFSVDAVFSGTDALSYLELGGYDACVLDVMMPGLDGISVLRQARQKGVQTPVLMLTAKAEIDDRVLGLDSGANYYLTKPFDTKELMAALRAITRTSTAPDTKITAGNITLDRATFDLSSPHGSFHLAGKEFQMMEMLMQNTGAVISAEQFMEKIWGFETETEINVVWVYLSYLRKKLTALKADVEIKVSRNIGYRLEKKV